MYKITFLPDAENSFEKLDKPVQRRIAKRLIGLLKMPTK